jgi:hypothetical protein
MPAQPQAVSGDNNLQRLAEPWRTAIGNYALRVQELAAARCRSLTLFGSIAAGTFDPGQHSIHNVLVLDPMDLDILHILAADRTMLRHAHIGLPLVLTPDFLHASLDTFPLELIEIQQQHLTILGDDYFAPLVFDAGFVRLQCERELKVLGLAMRQALLRSEGREHALGTYLNRAPDGILRLLRGLLWLRGTRRPTPAADVVHELQTLLGHELPGVRALLSPAGSRGWLQFRQLYEDLEALEAAFDGS